MREEEIKDNFIVGGKVTFKSGTDFEEYCFTGWMEEMRQFEGQEVTISAMGPIDGIFRIAEYPSIYFNIEQIDFGGADEKTVDEDIEKISFKKEYDPTDEELEEMINKVDIDTFNKVIKNRLYDEMSASSREALSSFNREWAKDYLKRWARSKYRFYKMLGDNIVINKEIEVELDSRYFNESIREIKEKFPLYAKIVGSIELMCITDNKLYEGGFPVDYLKDKRVKKNMKFTKFISLYENQDLDMEISKMYQTKGTANIHISIDPIDYLTVSVNNSGWHSCHNFFNGQYRNAGLSYMFDESSLVAFASNKSVNYNLQFPFEWNTKSWRQMVYISQNSSNIVFSRQYPYDDDERSKAVRSMIEGKVSKFFGSQNKWKLHSRPEKANLSVERPDGIQNIYNDVKQGFECKIAKNKQDENFTDFDTIYIGSEIKDLRKGETIVGGGSKLW